MKTIDAIRTRNNRHECRVHIKHDTEYDVYELWIYKGLESEPRSKKMYKTKRGVKSAFIKAIEEAQRDPVKHQ